LAAEHGPEEINAAAAPTSGNDQRRVTRADDKTPATAAAVIAAGATDRDLQILARGKGEVAADLGATTANPEQNAIATSAPITDAAALRARGEDLITAGCRHGEIDEATGICEVERHSAGGRA
jgi:hypothetical protein